LLLQQQASKDIHDPVLSSLKMEGIRFFTWNNCALCNIV
jgi:hypothetical protein